MKTKITLFLTAIWIALVALNESDIWEFIPENLSWIKAIVAVVVVLGNAFLVKPEIAKRSIGGGGIANPPPKK